MYNHKQTSNVYLRKNTKQLTVRGGVNPYGQPDRKISGFFLTTSPRILSATGSTNFSHPRTECSSLGGVLASIHSSEENDFIFSLIRIHAPYYGPTWIGASAISDYVWEWDDSTPWDFQNWDEGKMQFVTKKAFNPILCTARGGPPLPPYAILY